MAREFEGTLRRTCKKYCIHSKANTLMAKAPDDDFAAETTHGGGEGIRAPDFLLEKESLDRYLDLLAVKNLSVSYIEGNQRF